MSAALNPNAIDDRDVSEYGFVPNSEAQAHLLHSWAPTVAISGPLGTNKTRGILEAAHFDCCMWPNNRVAMTRKLATDLFSSMLDEYLSVVCHSSMRDGWRESKAGGSVMIYPNGSMMRWFGLDRPGKALTAQYGSAYCDQAEELDEDESRAIEGRLRLRRPPAPWTRADGSVVMMPLRRRMGYAFNPDGETHWANVRFGFYEMQNFGDKDPEHWTFRKIVRTTEPRKLFSGRVVPAGAPIAEVHIAKRKDNLANLSDDYQLRLTEYTGRYFDRWVLGLWGSFRGKAFDNFRETLNGQPWHVRDDPPEAWGWEAWGGYPPPTWKRYRGIDFGYENPFVMLWITRVPKDNPSHPNAWVVYREIYMTHRTVTAHGKQAREWDAEEVATLNGCVERENARTRAAWEGKPVHPAEVEGRMLEPLKRLRYGMQAADHDPENVAQLAELGIDTEPAEKARSAGTQTVYQALEPGPEGFPRLVFMRHARREEDPYLKDHDLKPPTCTWRELPQLKYPKQPKDPEKAVLDDIVKVNDHGFDALRYLLQTHKERGEMEVVR